MTVELMWRLAEPSDIPVIDALVARSIRALHAGIYSDALITEAIDHAYGVDWQLVRDRTYFVVTCGERIVGAGGWSYRQTIAGAHGPEDPPAPPMSSFDDAARIRAFYVDPNDARRGVGRLLLTLSETAARNAGFTRSQLTATLPAVPFYAAHGYREDGDFDLPLPSRETLRLRLMSKPLIQLAPERSQGR